MLIYTDPEVPWNSQSVSRLRHQLLSIRDRQKITSDMQLCFHIPKQHNFVCGQNLSENGEGTPSMHWGVYVVVEIAFALPFD